MEHSDSKMKSTYLLFDVFMELGRYEEAETLLVKMAAKPQFQYLIRKAKWEDHKGNLTFAIARLEEAKAQLNPQQQKGQAIWLYANLADFYGHAGRIEEAYQHYKMTLELDPANWYAYKGLAWIAYAQDGNPAEARKIVHQVMRYNDSPDLHLFLAELYEFEGNSACAEAEQYAFQQTSTQEAYGHMYRIPNLELLLAAGQTQEATKLARAEVQERPTSETYGFLSLALYRAGAVAEARELASNQLRFSFGALLLMLWAVHPVMASSHREAPLIANDPLADNTDLYAFRSPDDPNTVTIIANYIPAELPYGGPNYFTFGENIRYEIHIDNDASIPGDEIVYRFTFRRVNEDPTTFFNIRLGAQNLKTTYTLERSIDGGASFDVIVSGGVVPPNYIGPRSIESGVGLNTTYAQLMQDAITTSATGETVFAGPVDDPFYVDLGGVFDLGNSPRQNGENRDGLARYNVHTLALKIPISTLLKEGAPETPTSILDADYVIGIWASASRPAVRTLGMNGEAPTTEGDWIQVSRLGMPLTNEVVIPIGMKDYWNGITPYDELTDTSLDGFFYNPELALYMDDDLFGGAVPALAPLRIQRNALQAFDFGNGQDGLFGLKGSDAVAGTALDDAIFGTLLLPGPGQPRSVDLWPIFHTGVPNFPPYQLATGKDGNPLAAGKPFINNFLPNGGDMLRLNMAVPVTDRNDPAFSPLGIVQAAVLGLTDPTYASTAELEFIPNMDGFPNGRRLEDDVTRIELQAVGGVALAAIGLWYDDYTAGGANPVTQDLVDVLTYTTGVEQNDKAFSSTFPYVAMPWAGTEVAEAE
eukprot:g292.t1